MTAIHECYALNNLALLLDVTEKGHVFIHIKSMAT